MSVPENLARTIEEVHGERGRLWLAGLPALLAGAERRWGIAVLPPFPELSYNYAAPAVLADGTPAVLKAGVPNPELRSEAAALRLYGGDGIARLLDADDEAGLLLLERLQPGAPLAELAWRNDEAATAVAAQTMLRLWRPAPAEHPFPTVAGWAEGLVRLRAEFSGGTGPFDARLVEAAESHAAALLASAGTPMLLHGDLHHTNILSAEREPWLAIDPKGLVGEPGYEVGAFLYNQLPEAHADRRRVVARRVDQLAEALGIPREQLLGWGLFQSVLSSWWSYEDHGHGWDETMGVAEILSGLF